MRLLAIDPGPVESAWVIYDTQYKVVVDWAKESNRKVRPRIYRYDRGLCPTVLAIEEMKLYGQRTYAEVLGTCVWIGRFLENWDWHTSRSGPAFLIPRREIITHVCGSVSMKAADKKVRQALIDRWGGKDKAIGLKASPGPLYGLKADGWSALAIAVTCAETRLNSRKDEHV